jgi:hypothetical protein
MQALAIGFAVLLVVLIGGRWFATAPPATVLRILKWGGIVVAGLILLLVLRTGILPLIFAALAALVPWLVRAAQVHAVLKHVHARFGGGGAWRTAGRSDQADTSQVETGWLRMRLDHDSGELDGEVLAGAWSGRRLAELTSDQLAVLWREVQADPQSVQLLEAWLDRNHPDWRERMAAAGGRQADAGAMTRDEALAVLGLEDGADAAAIRAAHRRLMMACHPDHGGSDWLAARINRAKDVLLAETAQ